MTVITTDNVPPRERFEFWRDSIARSALEFRMEPVKHTPRGTARLATVGGLSVMKFDGSVVARYTRTRTEISRSQAPRYFVQIQLRTQCVLDHGKDQSLIEVGDGFVADPLREFDMRFATPENPHKRVLVAGFLKEAVSARVARPDLVHGAVLRHSRPLMRLLTGYLLTGLEIAAEMTPQDTALFEDHAVELLAQALRESRAEEVQPSEAWREALFLRACRLIRLRYGDPALGAEPLAAELGVSNRLLQRIFAQRGETIMRRIFAERIARAAQLLRAREAAHRTVTDIAFSCGFNDSSHFGRVFAAHMSMTPTDWRRRGPEPTAL